MAKEVWETPRDEFVDSYPISDDDRHCFDATVFPIDPSPWSIQPNSINVLKNCLGPNRNLFVYCDEDSMIQAFVVFSNGACTAAAAAREYRKDDLIYDLMDVAVDNGLEYCDDGYLNRKNASAYHKFMVIQAIRRGDSVPDIVLSDYPELMLKKASKIPVVISDESSKPIPNRGRFP